MGAENTLGLKLAAIDRMSAVLDKVQGKLGGITGTVMESKTAFKIFNMGHKETLEGFKKSGEVFEAVGKKLTLGVTVPITAAAVASVKFFADFESGLRKVKREANLSKEDTEALGNALADIATHTPTSTAELLEFAEAGAELGIQGRQNIEKFSATMAKLSKISDLTGAAGARSVARFVNVTGIGAQNVDKFSAALTELQDNSIGTESQILGAADDLFQKVGRFGVSGQQVLGLAAAMTTLGQDGGQSALVFSKSFEFIDQAIQNGGMNLRVLEKITGQTGKELKQNFKTNAVGVFQEFVAGLGKVQSGGGNLIKVLDFMGLEGARTNAVFGTLAKKPNEIAEQLARSSQAFEANTALMAKFNDESQTLNAVFSMTYNKVQRVGSLIGESLAPVVKTLANVFGFFLDMLAGSPVLRALLIVFGGLAAAVGPILLAFGALLTLMPSMIAGWAALTAATLPITGTTLLIAAGIMAVIAAITILVVKWKDIKKWFSENIFGLLHSNILLALGPLGAMIRGVTLLGEKFGFLKTQTEAMPSPDAMAGALGPPIGAREQNRGLATQAQIPAPLSGNIDVNFRNAPPGTTATGRSQGDLGLGLNMGFAGGFQ